MSEYVQFAAAMVLAVLFLIWPYRFVAYAPGRRQEEQQAGGERGSGRR